MKRTLTLGGLAALTLAAVADADVHVRRVCLDAQGNVVTSAVVSTVSSGQQITINPAAFSPSCGGDPRATFVVYADLSSEDIGRIVFTGSGGSLVNDLLITGGNQTEVNSDADMTATGRDWAGVDPGPYSMQVQGRIGRDLTGSVTAGNVVRLRVGGTITASADILQTDATQPIHSVFAAGEIAGDVWAGNSTTAANGIVLVTSTGGNISGSIRAWSGNVGTISAPNGTISGSIYSSRGKISLVSCKNFTGEITANGQFQAPGGYWAIDTIQVTEDIGTESTSATITTAAGDSLPTGSGFNNGGIYSLRARSIHANIATPSAASNRGDIREMVTTGTGAGQGYYKGSLTAFSMGETGTSSDPQRAVKLTGPLLGQIGLNGTLKRPAEMRSLENGAYLSLIRQDQSPTGAIIVNGDVAAGGLIEIAGDQEGLVQVNNGDVAGTIAVGMSIMNPSTMMTNYTGRLEINNGSLLASGLIEVGLSVAVASAIPGNSNPTEIKIDGDLAGTISIGRSLLGDVTVGDDLSGQVIINANNQSGAEAGVWSGAVSVGSTTLSPDAHGRYATPASSIGGGAVGLAPYRLYEGDCSPPHGQTAIPPLVPPLAAEPLLATHFASASNIPVWITHYGPVAWGPGSPRITTEVQDPDDPCAWWPVTGAFGTPVLHPTGSGTGGRVIGLRGTGTGIPYAGVYRVSIAYEGVVSSRVSDVANSTTPIWPLHACTDASTYTFRIFPDCNLNNVWDAIDIDGNPGLDQDSNGMIDACEIDTQDVCRCDWNENRVVSVQDLFDFLEDYFAGYGDFNLSGATSVQDIFDFLACFFGLPDPCTRL